MTLIIPGFITSSIKPNSDLRYEWDEWDLDNVIEPIDDDFYSRLKAISKRAVLAFAISTGEWIVYRYDGLMDTTIAKQNLEAAWLQIIHWRYVEYTWEEYTDEVLSTGEGSAIRKKSDKWTGPVAGPIWKALSSIRFAISQCEEGGSPAVGASWVTNIALHVLHDTAPYLEWRNNLVSKFEKLYAFDKEDPFGIVVPREVCNLIEDFEISNTENLINNTLVNFDYKDNPFSNSPEKMIKQGFVGTPYNFDLESDKRIRDEW